MRSVLNLVVMIATAASVAGQVTIDVPGSQPTIQAGINAASNGDTVLVAPGTYFEQNISFGGKAITVRSSLGAAVTTVNAQNAGRAFLFDNGETAAARLEDFTITGGRAANGALPGSSGGAMRITGGASPTVMGCVFFQNQAGHGLAGVPFTSPHGGPAGHGGAVMIDQGTPAFIDCVFVGNHAGRGGNGASAFTNPASPVLGNGGQGGHGGAVYVTGAAVPSFRGCVFNANAAGDAGDADFGGIGGNGGWGGAVFCVSGDPIFDACSFDLNTGGDGGEGGSALLTPPGAAPAGHAGGGGAFALTGGTTTIRDSSFDDNSGGTGGDGGGGVTASNAGHGGPGGAVLVAGAFAAIQRSTFTSNTAGTGGDGGVASGVTPFQGTAGNGGDGGAIAVTAGGAAVAACVFRANVAGHAGGSFSLNTPADGGDGGAIAATSGATSLDVDTCLLQDNEAGRPQIIMAFGTFYGAYGRGGAISSLATTASMSFCVAYGNRTDSADAAHSGDGGGLYGNAGLTIDHTIAWNNHRGIPAQGGFLQQISGPGGSPPLAIFCDVQGGVTTSFIGVAILDADPMFADTVDFRLTPPSPCVDAGDPTATPGVGGVPLLDIDGDPRLLGAAVDMGIDELFTPPFPGTGEDFVQYTFINDVEGAPSPLHGIGGDRLTIAFESPLGTFDNFEALVLAQIFVPGNPPIGPAPFTAVMHIDPAANPGPVALVGGATGIGTPIVAPGGTTVHFILPSVGLNGLSVMIQSWALTFGPPAANGFLATSDGHELRVQ